VRSQQVLEEHRHVLQLHGQPGVDLDHQVLGGGHAAAFNVERQFLLPSEDHCGLLATPETEPLAQRFQGVGAGWDLAQELTLFNHQSSRSRLHDELLGEETRRIADHDLHGELVGRRCPAVVRDRFVHCTAPSRSEMSSVERCVSADGAAGTEVLRQGTQGGCGVSHRLLPARAAGRRTDHGLGLGLSQFSGRDRAVDALD
jgi:hypothetical protein